MNKIIKVLKPVIFVFITTIVLAVWCNPDWTGGGSTEWSDPANWDKHDWDVYKINPEHGASSYNITFNRDGRTFTQPSADEMNAYETKDWDYYWIWQIGIDGMSNDRLVTWAGDTDECGPRVNNLLCIGVSGDGRGALAINRGNVEVGDAVLLGQNRRNEGELVLNGGKLTVQNGFVFGEDGWRGILGLYGGILKVNKSRFLNGPSYSAFKHWGEAQFHFDGGTIQSGNENQSFPVDGAIFGPKGLVFDTAGMNATLLETVNATILNGSTLTKKGEGTLTVDAPFADGLVKVESGVLAFATDGKRTLKHRWSFDGDATDYVTGENTATVLNGVKFEGGKAVFASVPDNDGSYGIDLGANLWPTSAMTLEIWFMHEEEFVWAKPFCWGRNGDDCFQYTLTDGNSSVFGLGGEGGTGNTWATGRHEIGVPYCITVTFVPNIAGGCHVRLARWNALTGALVDSRDYNTDSWTLASRIQNHFYLGKNFWNNSIPASKYDEVRVWEGVFSDSELKQHVMMGPDALPGENDEAAFRNARLAHRWSFTTDATDSVLGTCTATAISDGTVDNSV